VAQLIVSAPASVRNRGETTQFWPVAPQKMLRPAVIVVLLSSIATHLFVGVETAFPVQGVGPDSNFYTGDLLPRQRAQSAADGGEAGAMPPLLLPPAVGGAPEVFCSSAPVQPARFEEAGASHHRLMRLRAGIEDIKLDIEHEVNETASKGDESPPDSPEEAERKSVRAGMADSDDHYDILGLDKVRWRATEDQIKKAYHRTSLRCHPDKVCGQGEGARKAADEHYKKVNRAYAVLSDRQKVRC